MGFERQGGLAGGVRGLVSPFVCLVAGTQVVVGVKVRGDDGRIETISARELAAMQEEPGGIATKLEIVGFVTRNIEDIVARGGGEMGDGGRKVVISRDQHDPDGPLVYRRIARTYQRTAYGLQVLTVRDADGAEQTLRVTEEHPFYVEFAGWTPAKSLRPGDTILGADGALEVVSNEYEAHLDGVAVYNLEVEDAHTYFVLAAGASDAAAVWVHNATNYQRTKNLKKQGFQEHHVISDKNSLTQDHELLGLAGFDLQSRRNKIFLPDSPGLHPTRSIHSGKHSNSVSERLADAMDQIVLAGRAAGFTKDQYNIALRSLIASERRALKAGTVGLNKNRRPWAV